MQVFLHTYCGIIDTVIHDIREQEKNQIQKDVLTMLIQSVGSSARTLFKITDAAELSIKDAFIVMRSVVETTTNVGLILSDEIYAEKAHKHALQRTARFMMRKRKVGNWEFRTESIAHKDFLERSDVQEALKEYGERDNWIKESMPKKIEIIERHHGSCIVLSGLYYSIYSKSSELIHGSYFGVINFYGFNKNNDDIELQFLSIQTEILFGAISCLDFLIKLGNKKYLLEKQSELSESLFNSVLEKTKHMIEKQVVN